MTAVSRESLAALRALATEATPGPWAVDHMNVVGTGAGWWSPISYNPRACDEDADYIAAADPTTVLGLIAALDAVLDVMGEAVYVDALGSEVVSVDALRAAIAGPTETGATT